MNQQTVLKGEAVVAGQGGKRTRRGHVRVFERWCKGCGLCVAFCPQQVFELGTQGKSVVVHPERCTACEWCYVHCPDYAIAVRRLDEGDRGGEA